MLGGGWARYVQWDSNTITADPNPEIAESQEFATAALHDGISYPELLHRIVALGMQRAAAISAG
jgi:D-alanine-D-alanine ligase